MTATTYRLPPGPRLPRALQGAAFLLGQQQVFRALGRRHRDAFTAELPGFGRTVVVTHPALAKQTFTADPAVLHVGSQSPLGKVLGRGSLFSLDEAEHLRERRLLLPPFHGERMKSYEAIIEDEALKEIAAWPSDEPFETLEPFMRITLNAILRTVFGADDEEFDGLRALLPGMTKLGSRLVMLPVLHKDLGPRSPWGRFVRQRAEFDGYVATLIAMAKADPELERRSDTLALLVQSRYEDGDELSHAAIADQLLTLLVAGHETTAGSLAWTVERLRRHPELLRRLVAETDAGGKELREATIRETQRSRPVISGTVRFVKQDFQLGPWLLPPGTAIVVSAALTHGDERYYEHADRFDPDRFVGRKPDTYAWTPFGGGLRRCIGAAFAHMEMDVVLRTLLRQVELVPTDEPDERMVFRGVAFAPGAGGTAVVRRRTPGQADATTDWRSTEAPVRSASVPAATAA